MDKIFIQNKYRLDFTPLFEDIEHIFEKNGEVIYHERNTIKVFEWSSHLINVKKFAVPHPINRFVYRYLRKPKCVRALTYALRLQTLGIPTPEPIGYLVRYRGIEIAESYLVTLQSPLGRNFYEFDEGGVSGREDIINGLAHFAAEMHDKGVVHLDFSPGNILFDKNQLGEWEYTIVDINRMKFAPVSLREGCANLQRLWGGLDFLRILANGYAEARGADPDVVYDTILHYHSQFWRGYNRWY